jgi:hypothetical protein
MSDNPKLRKNGGEGTWAGNALRAIVKTGKQVAPEILAIASDITGVDVLDNLASLIREDAQLTEFEKQVILAELEKDRVILQEVTKRWEADAKSDSWLSKNVRPITAFLFLGGSITFAALDSSLPNFNMEEGWMTLLKDVSMTIIIAYFGVGRSMFDKGGLGKIVNRR